MAPKATWLSAALALGLLGSAMPARADEITLRTQLGTWDEAVAALRADTTSEGTALRVSVRAGGSPLPCDRYKLALDEAAVTAFRVTSCDPSTQETSLELVHRAALFDERYHVPQPRAVTVTATVTFRTTQSAVGDTQGGSLVRCSIAVRPYLDDALHGTRVLLTPEHYELEPGSALVTVTPDAGGWSLNAPERAGFRIKYSVVDRGTGEVVLREDASFSCGSDARPVAPIERPLDNREHASILTKAPEYSPPVPLEKRITRTLGWIALAGILTSAGFWAGYGVGSNRTNESAQDAILIPALISSALAATAVGVFVVRLVPSSPKRKRYSMIPVPTFGASKQGASFGATVSF